MLSGLLATLLICIGVANTTPICNYADEKQEQRTIHPKRENDTTNYTINIQHTGSSQNDTRTTIPIPNTYYPASNWRVNFKSNFMATGNYINVLATNYTNQTRVSATTDNNENVTPIMIENKVFLDNTTGGLDYRIRERTETAYIYKLTPYNYNIDTTLKIRTVISLGEWTTQADVDWFIYESYFIRNIYLQTETIDNKDLTKTWDRYIGMQPTEFQAYDMCRNIENVDNGFYYIKKQNLIQIGYNTVERTNYYDEIEIDITPNRDNYIVIEYIPIARAVEMGDGQSDEQLIPLIGTIGAYTEGNTITGTNIIPSGRYEIIDIPGLMFEIIGMPFAFVSQAFNLTLFPGTPYQINIANLFLSIIAVFIFVWIITIIIKIKAGG